MITLRDYQQPFYNDILSEVSKGTRKICGYLPTGGGKSVIIAKLASEGLKGRTLILTHRIEIFEQNSAWIPEVGLLSSSKNTLRYDCRVIVAMVQTVDARLKNYGNQYLGRFDNIILDEVHILIFEKVFNKYNYSTLIGLTGSPVVYGKKLEWLVGEDTYVEDYTLSKMFDTIVIGPDTEDLIKIGKLVEDYTITLKLPDFDKLKESKSNSDGYTSKSMNEVYYNTVSLDKLTEAYNKYCKGKKVIIFNSSNKINKFVCDHLKSIGVNAKMFDTSKEREINPETGNKYTRREMVEWFRNEREAVLVNTNVFTTGFDVDDIEVIIVNRATKSLALWIQMVGRGSRITNKIFKDKFLVLDLGQNVYEHGLWSARRDWKKLFYGSGPRLKKNLDYLKIWECVHCGYYNPQGELKCLDCGEEHIVIKQIKDKNYKDGEFTEIGELKPPKGNKIVRYCQENNLTVNDAFKILTNSIVELFVFYKVSPEFYKNRKNDYYDKNGNLKKGFDNRIMDIYRPAYFAILDKDNGLPGNRSRRITTTYNRIMDKVKKQMGYE